MCVCIFSSRSHQQMDHAQLVLRGAIDERFLTGAARHCTHRMMVVMISIIIVTVEGAASSCLVLILLLILLMLTTTSGTTATAPTAIPGSIRLPLSLGRRRLLLLLLLLLRCAAVTAAASVDIGRVDRATMLMIRLLAVDVRVATVVMKICGPLRLCAVIGGVARLHAHRLNGSISFVRVARIFRSSATSVVDSFIR